MTASTVSVWQVPLAVYLVVVCTCTHTSGVCRCDMLTARELLVRRMYQRVAMLASPMQSFSHNHTHYVHPGSPLPTCAKCKYHS